MQVLPMPLRQDFSQACGNDTTASNGRSCESPGESKRVGDLIELGRQVLGKQIQVLFAKPISEAASQLRSKRVHQMRVATRRARAALRLLRDCLPGKAVRNLNRDLKWLARELGPVRDLDVFRLNLRRCIRKAEPELAADLKPLLKFLQRSSAKLRRSLRKELNSKHAQRLSKELRKLLTQLAGDAFPNYLQVVRHDSRAAIQVLEAKQQEVLLVGRSIGKESPASAYHRLRIECKRLRYLLEACRHENHSEFEQTRKLVKRIQRELGELQDAQVAVDLLRRYVGGLPLGRKPGQKRRLLVGIGQLISAQQAAAERAKRRFQRAWRAFASLANKQK
jgi:CHAD domain-containing protein